jgi:hypothetical protein
MAGILDFLQSPDAQLGIGLLAAGGPTTDPNQTGFGQRLQSAMNGMTANQQIAMRAKLMQSQIDENAVQNQLRAQQMVDAQRKQAILAQWAAGGSGGAPAGGGGSVGGGGGMAAGAGPDFSPATLARLKLAGIDMTDVAKLAQPNWQNVNGNMVNTNDPNFKGGFQPGMSTSANGQVTQWQPDGRGGLVVGAPAGALDTFSAYQGAQANYKPIKVYNPATGRDEYTTEGAVVQPGRAPQGPAGYANEAQMRATAGGDMGADPKAIAREVAAVQKDLLTKQMDGPSREMLKAHLADLLDQGKRIGAPTTAPQSGNYAAGPSANEAASAAGRQATASSIGGKAGELLKESSDAANSATQSVASAQRMVQALDSDKVLTGPGASLHLKGLQIASTLGMQGKDDAEKIANTRQAVQEMAKLTLEGRKQMSGQGAITNQESALAEKATSGSIDDLTAPEIRQLAQAAERTGRWKYAQHEAKMNAMSQDPAMAGNVALYKAAPMPDPISKPAATLKTPPSASDIQNTALKYGITVDQVKQKLGIQ